MEIKLTQKELPIWIEGNTCTRRAQVSTELVIPDTMEDASRIVWTRGVVFLKGKEPGIHETKVAGEAKAWILILTESGKLDCLSASKSFDMCFDTEAVDEEALPWVYFDLPAVETRMLNPRKLSLVFDIQAGLKSFSRSKLVVESALSEGEWKGLHLQREETEALTITQVREKTLTIREQLSLPRDFAGVKKLAGEEVRFEKLSTEQIGNRCIVKGELLLRLWGICDDDRPLSSESRLPFSLLLDTGEESMDACALRIEPSSLYLELSDCVGEDRSVDIELHAVAQACLFTRNTVHAIRDAYSTKMPAVAELKEISLLRELKSVNELVREERLTACPDDLEELLASEGKLGALEEDSEQNWIPMTIDFLYLKKDGGLDAARRTMRIGVNHARIENVHTDTVLRTFSLKKQEEGLLASCEAEMTWQSGQLQTFSFVNGITLEEEKAWKEEAVPGLFLVRRADESLWDLAKAFHSSVEAIQACNPEESEMLLIPTE